MESRWTVGPLRDEPLAAGTVAVYEHHVAALGLNLVEVENTASTSTRCLPPVMMTGMPAGRCKRVS